MARRLLLTITMIAFVGTLYADVVHLKDGRKLEGKIIREGKDSLVIRMKYGEVTIEKKDVDKIEKKEWEEPPTEQNLPPKEQPEPETQKPVVKASPELKKKVDTLVQKLADEKYSAREEAEKEMQTLLQDSTTFDVLLSYLKEQLKAAKDDELKTRLGRIIGPYVGWGISSPLLKKFPDIITRLNSSDKVIRANTIKELKDMNHPAAVEPLVRLAFFADWSLRDLAAKALIKIGTPAVNAVIRVLDSNSHARDEAAEVLKQIGKSAVDPLIKVLGNGYSDDSREVAAETLGNIGDARAVEPLIKALGDKRGQVCRAAAEALVKIGKPAIESLVKTCAKGSSRGDSYYPALWILSRIKDPQGIDALIKALDDENPNIRQMVAEALGEMRDAKAVQPLIKALSASIPWGREKVAEALGKLKDARALEPLISALQDKEYEVRKQAAVALGEIGSDKAVEALVRVLSSSNIRDSAALALGKIRSANAVEPLIKALEDEDADVRAAAAWALGDIKDPKAVEPLIKALNDSDYKMAEAPAWALGEIRDKRATVPLLEAFKAERYRTGSSGNKEKALVEALGKLGDPKVIPILMDSTCSKELREVIVDALIAIGKPSVDALTEFLGKGEGGYWEREVAAEVLGRLKDMKAAEALIKALGDNRFHEVREAAAEALSQLGEPAIDLLLKTLSDSPPLIRAGAANALGKLGNAKATEPLIKALSDPEPWVRQSAAYALGRLRPASGVGPLTGVLSDPDSEVRRAASWALGEIGEKEAVGSLIRMLEDNDDSVRLTAAQALGKVKDSTAVDALAKVLSNDEEYKVRVAACLSLGSIGDEKGFEPLIRALDDTWGDVARAAASALENIRW